MTTAEKNKPKDPLGKPKDRVLEFPEAAVLQSVVGEQDSNIKIIEQKLQVRIGRAEDGLKVSGLDNDVDLASDLLVQMRELVAGGDAFYNGDVERAIHMLSEDRRARLSDMFREQIRIAGRKHAIVPKTETQRLYLETIRNNDVIFGVGPAGTGKTYLAMAMAVAALMRKDVKRIVLCRPAVEAGEKLGFLPGDMAEKVNPYLRPLYDALHDMIDMEKAQELITKGSIEVAPLAFMRGRTLSNAFVILDEAQNTTRMQMKMLLTRIGIGSKCVVTGDVTQIDLPRGIDSGLEEALSILKNVEGIQAIKFSGEDVIRHRVVSRIVAAYDRKEKANQGE